MFRGRETSTRTGDRGAVLVEFAIFAPVLVLLLIGLLEYGLAWSDSQQAAGALANGARVTSNLGPEVTADYQGLSAFEAELDDIDNTRIDRVVIYEADSAGGDIPESCKTSDDASVWDSLNCNVYTGSQIDSMTASDFTDEDCSGQPDQYWCPSERDEDQLSADFVGMWVSITYEWKSGLFPGNGLTIEDRGVFRIEPPLDD
ncbi:MAG: TadE/TadG family type IV pilus assembly protein [Acidimicrobiia bacterium]|nr:TadE/TadG family type IV pilus assembly protein [Acidimicrobiia bacterium]